MSRARSPEDDLDRLYRAFREAGTNGTLEISEGAGTLEIAQGSGRTRARLIVYGSPGEILAEIRRLHEQGTDPT